MTAGLRKASLTAHLTTSLAWLGAVASFLALATAGLLSQDVETVRSAYLAMNLIGESIIVPLGLAAFVTGIVQSLGTRWGLFRYWWVVAKLALTLGATALLLLHQFTAVSEAARRVSASAPATMPDIGGFGVQLAVDAGAAVIVLLVIAALGVYKPWGRTPYGRRKQREELSEAPGPEPATDALPVGLRLFIALVGLVFVTFVVVHLAGGGLGRHGP